MARTKLKNAIEKAAADFALVVVDAVKGATLEELILLQKGRPGRKPGRKPGPKAGAKRGPKKRVARNYPKCAYPGCNKNRFPRGKGFCGSHWRSWEAGKIKAASFYKKKTVKKAPTKKKTTRRSPAKKKVVKKG